MSKVYLPSSVSGIPVTVQIVNPKGKQNVRRLIPIKRPLYIVVHNTGNTSRGADAEAHARYIQNVENADTTYVSWHFSVDHDSIVQHLPMDEPGWHAGDGSKGVGNSNGIAIEICENGTPAQYKQAEENAIQLIRYIQRLHAIPINRVQPHRHFMRKLCPRRILKSEATWVSDWKQFQARVENAKTPTAPVSSVVPKPTSSQNIKAGDKVTVKSTASRWATGQTIPSWVKGKKYTVKQVNGDRVLLEGVLSWIYTSDVTVEGKTLTTKSKVRIRGNVTHYATGQKIPSWVKSTTYSVSQIKNDRVLLEPIRSWLYVKDVEVV